jgi:hypothetical protein
VIADNCLRPIKYLRYLAWCIVFREGSILHENETVEDDAEIVDKGEYLFRSRDGAGALFLSMFSCPFLTVCRMVQRSRGYRSDQAALPNVFGNHRHTYPL